jgi:transcriptional regulator with XRE-family HTH domain
VKKKRRAGKAKVKRPALEAMRKRAGLSREQLAVELGVNRTLIWHWEHGKSFPKRSRWPQVAAALGVTVAKLLASAAVEEV